MSSEECPQGCEHSEKDREKEGSWFSDEVMSSAMSSVPADVKSEALMQVRLFLAHALGAAQ